MLGHWYYQQIKIPLLWAFEEVSPLLEYCWSNFFTATFKIFSESKAGFLWSNRGIQGNCKSGNYFIFWARDFLSTWRNPKQEFFDLGRSHIPTGESQNGNCPLKGHILDFALRTGSIHKFDLHMCHWFIWGENLFEILYNFSCCQLLLKPSQICNALSTKT